MKKMTIDITGLTPSQALTFVIIAAILVLAINWLITCILVWLICTCFHLTFDLAIATGVWLVILILKSIFSHNVTVKK